MFFAEIAEEHPTRAVWKVGVETLKAHAVSRRVVSRLPCCVKAERDFGPVARFIGAAVFLSFYATLRLSDFVVDRGVFGAFLMSPDAG